MDDPSAPNPSIPRDQQGYDPLGYLAWFNAESAMYFPVSDPTRIPADGYTLDDIGLALSFYPPRNSDGYSTKVTQVALALYEDEEGHTENQVVRDFFAPYFAYSPNDFDQLLNDAQASGDIDEESVQKVRDICERIFGKYRTR
jgi:hypothetical protein